MEKADILEMTVAYLQLTQSRRRRGLDVSPAHAAADVDRYAAGFRQCAVHVGQYLLDAGVNFSAVHERLMAHLDNALHAAVVDDVAMGKVAWTDDDATGRCSPITDDDDDDDCRSVSGTTASVDCGDVVRRQYAACRPAAAATAIDSVALQLNNTTSSMMSSMTTTITSHGQTRHPGADADSPRTADEFPSFSSNIITTTITDAYTPSVPSDVIEDTVRDARHVTSSLSKSSPVTCSADSITDDSSNVWQPWR